MVRSTWLRRAGPGIVALGAVAILASTTLGAPTRPWVPPDCLDAAGRTDASVRAMRGGVQRPPDRAPWFRLDPVLDGAGALTGQRLVVGRADGSGRRTVSLPAESFAAGPFGAIVLAGSDDGSSSRLLAVDVLDGCITVLARSTDVIRRATISPDGATVFEHRVDRATRTDLGTWRRAVDDSDVAEVVLPPIGPDARFGRTWSTEFLWSVEDGSLAIQSCGEVACRTRVVDPGDGPALELADPELGTAIGLARGRLVSYLACPGLPCPVVVTELVDGHRRTLAPDAGLALVTATADGVRLVHSRGVGRGATLRSMTLEAGGRVDLGPVPDGLDLLVHASRAGAGLDVPPGWLLLVPEGRPTFDGSTPAPILRHVLDGRSATLDEVLP